MEFIRYKFLVRNLNWTVGVTDLKKTFSVFGEVHSAWVDFDKATGFSKGTGCVCYTHHLNKDYLMSKPVVIHGEPIEIEEAST